VCDEVCYVGEMIVMVVVRDCYIVEDVVGWIVVFYELLEVVVDIEVFVVNGACVYCDCLDNVVVCVVEEYGDVDVVFVMVVKVFEWCFEIECSVVMLLEGCVVVVCFDEEGGLFVYDVM